MRKTVAAVIVAGLFLIVTLTSAIAQPKVISKVLLNNAEVLVTLSKYPPGSVNPLTKRLPVLVYVVAGPQHTKRSYADGHSTMLPVYPTGAAHFEPAGTTSLTNTGSNTYTTLAVFLKK